MERHQKENVRERAHTAAPVVQCLVLLLGLLSIVGIAGNLRAAEPVQHVVLISVDGLPGAFLNNPAVPLDAIRGLAQQGVSSSDMTVTNPAVTWPNHTSLLTGTDASGHGVLFNGVMRRTGYGMPVQLDSRTDKSQLVRIATLPDVLHAQGKSVVGINWPCTRNSGSLMIDFPDTPDAMRFTTPQFIDEMIQAGLVTSDIRETFKTTPPIMRDWIWTQAACLALRQHRPTFTMIHLLNVDAVHHRYGSGTWAGSAAVAYADTCVGQILKTLDETGMRPTTAVFVVSDHGFQPIPKTINPNVVLRNAGLIGLDGTRIASASAHAFAEGGTAMIYLTRPDTRENDRRVVTELFQNLEGVAAIIPSARFAEFGLPDPDDYPQMGDLVLVAKDGYGFKDQYLGEDPITPSEGTLGTHGFPSSNPSMNAIFVAAGAGIRSGVQLDGLKNIQIAPTIARLLEVELPAAQGKPVVEILESRSPQQ
ncbi:alkaline phosphatase family protein [Planctomicrobium sp. SH664]|uniref:alkaline phosphatase family protein n=1 Tax=Planctomicrobium sp. SH664 TaxID=3448125 RepID=UPI003F5BC1E0